MADHEPVAGRDTGGVPWHGRELTDNPFAQDTGNVDPLLAAALADPDEEALLAAVARARLFVPVVAAPGDEAAAGTDSVADMATVVLTSPDGERALPAFSSLTALTGWDAAARPVPVTAQTLAQAAVQERCDAVVVDLGHEQARVLRASMVYALAQGRAWVPADQDVVVGESVDTARAAVVADERLHGLVHDVRVGGLTPSGELRVDVVVPRGLDRQTLHLVLAEVGRQLSGDVELRARIDGVTFSVVAGPGAGPVSPIG
ncbi:hypothetical protein ADJ73_10845 [Arsenicicoccus sp. oral taxon 190]|nr:hypothetical protein ADJ73_10845 [Arsenicicoccus sp. oral taxon 190]